MQNLLLQSTKNNDYSVLKQLVLTIPFFNEIQFELQNTELFQQLIRSIKIDEIGQQVNYQLNQKYLYIFLCKGVIINSKDKKQQTYQRFSRLSKLQKTPLSFIQRESNMELQKQRCLTIQAFQLYNQGLLFNSPTFSTVNQEFVNLSAQKSVILKIGSQSIPGHIAQVLHQRHLQKTKFITSFHLFKYVQKCFIQTVLDKFQLLKIPFDQFLVKPKLRDNSLLFSIKGQVEICQQNQTYSNKNASKKKVFLMKAPAIINLNQIKYAKSTTQNCVSYCIQKSQVLQIFRKSLQNKHKTPEIQKQLKYYIKMISGDNRVSQASTINVSQFSPSNSQILPPVPSGKPFLRIDRTKTFEPSLNHFERDNRCSTSGIQSEITINQSFLNFQQQNQSFLAPRQQNIKKTLLKLQIGSGKKLRIKQHFCNFLNDRYAQFSLKKSQLLEQQSPNPTSTVLYQMKSLISKSPEMSQINQKLKLQRLKRINRCKQNIESTKQQSLNCINLRNYKQFQDYRIVKKIKRGIDNKIWKRQHFKANKIQKNYVPTTDSYNRMSQVSAFQ